MVPAQGSFSKEREREREREREKERERERKREGEKKTPGFDRDPSIGLPRSSRRHDANFYGSAET